MLADIIRGHKNLCKPELFERTRSIILRYNEVDAELRKVIDSPHKLTRLKWLIKQSKAKILSKKVEGIKVALVLELNIVRLAREEIIRPYNDANFNVQIRNTTKANRFRRIVESAVRANRQVVEDARRHEIENNIEKHPHIAAELDIWKADSFDTATWLYNLVFSPETPDPPARRLHQASVEDADNLNPPSEASLSSITAESNISINVNGKEMIVWSRQTEPSQVVDRLLYAWTTLSPDQIGLSATRESGDDWRDDVMSMVEKTIDADTSSFQDWETLAEEDKDAAGIRQAAHERAPPPIAVPPPQKPTEPAESLRKNATPFDTTRNENSILSKLEKLLNYQENGKEYKTVVTDARFARLEQLLTSNAEAEAQREIAMTEEQLTEMKHAEEQRKMEAKWREERTTMDLRAAEQAQESRELAAKEVAAAQAAKEAAETSLRFAQSEADKRAREEAATKVAEEKKKIEDAHKQQLERYEELLRVVKEQRSESDQNTQASYSAVCEEPVGNPPTLGLHAKAKTTSSETKPYTTYFFQADYKPQFTTSTTSPSTAPLWKTMQLGFRFHLNETGFYILDAQSSHVTHPH
ncbi:hypothetical protein HRS9139_10416 [Pyrenophora teres f. teres]|nr:hypothetical protein HRS9139_10416 [Pyrenophora teres f. teres]KAE8858665.1 hypothetical protein PTNB29_07880 [Pyrenophora teres f. teres]